MKYTWMRGVIMILQIGRYLQTDPKEYKNFSDDNLEWMKGHVVRLKRVTNQENNGNNKDLDLWQQNIFQKFDEFLL